MLRQRASSPNIRHQDSTIPIWVGAVGWGRGGRTNFPRAMRRAVATSRARRQWPSCAGSWARRRDLHGSRMQRVLMSGSHVTGHVSTGLQEGACAQSQCQGFPAIPIPDPARWDGCVLSRVWVSSSCCPNGKHLQSRPSLASRDMPCPRPHLARQRLDPSQSRGRGALLHRHVDEKLMHPLECPWILHHHLYIRTSPSSLTSVFVTHLVSLRLFSPSHKQHSLLLWHTFRTLTSVHVNIQTSPPPPPPRHHEQTRTRLPSRRGGHGPQILGCPRQLERLLGFCQPQRGLDQDIRPRRKTPHPEPYRPA